MLLSKIKINKNLPKNLFPKFKPDSRITSNVMEIMYDVLDNPIKINNGICNGQLKKQISSYNKNCHIAEYNYKISNDLY